MKEQTLSSVERCTVLSVDSKPLGVLDIHDTFEVLVGRSGSGAGMIRWDNPDRALLATD